MKKNLLYLLALICSMVFFTGCSNDDDSNWKKLPSQSITADELTLTTNIQVVQGASVKLAMTNGEQGVLTLNKAIVGLDEVVVDVTVTEQADGSFKFQGEKVVSVATRTLADLVGSTTVKVAGRITLDSKAEVAVTTETAGLLVKKWQLCDSLFFDNKARFAPCRINWVSPYGEDGVAADNIQTVGTNALSAVMTKLLKDVEFKADGSIVANYAEEVTINMTDIIMASMGTGMPSVEGITWLSSSANLASWYAKDSQIYVVLNIPAIIAESMKGDGESDMSPELIMNMINTLKTMKGAEIKKLLGGFLASAGADGLLSKLDISKISDADAEKFIGYLTTGFPLGCQVSDVTLKSGAKVKDVYLYLDKGLFDMFMPAIYPILPDVEAMLRATTIELSGEPFPVWVMIEILLQIQSLTEIEYIWKQTSEFKIGLDLADGSFKKKN